MATQSASNRNDIDCRRIASTAAHARGMYTTSPKNFGKSATKKKGPPLCSSRVTAACENAYRHSHTASLGKTRVMCHTHGATMANATVTTMHAFPAVRGEACRVADQ